MLEEVATSLRKIHKENPSGLTGPYSSSWHDDRNSSYGVIRSDLEASEVAT
jgi:hypothetical protein